MSAENDSLASLVQLQVQYPPTKDCKELSKQINLLILHEVNLRNQNFVVPANVVNAYNLMKKAEFKKLGCEKTLSTEKAGQINEIVDQYTMTDKERIEADSKKQRNIRILIGASILVTALGILIYKTRKE